MHPLMFLSLALYSLSTVVSSGDGNEGPRGFSIDLIHRDSPLSPFYDPSLTPSERIINAASRSISRLNRVSHILDDNNKLPESLLIPDYGEYVMRFYIGTPPVERLAIADTGSNLVWVQCSPCENCFPQNTPLFEPNNSSTFMAATCDSQPCTSISSLQEHYCGKEGLCIYRTAYVDNSFSIGVIGTETLAFGSTGGGAQSVSFPNFVLGCGLSNNLGFHASDKNTGIVGLGAGSLSLVSQLGAQTGYKFSYCLVPGSSTSTSKLKFGSEAIISANGVVSTPFTLLPYYPTFYYLNLDAITIGQKVVLSQFNGEIIIDSGTVLTYLEYTFYYDFVASLQETLGVELVQDLPDPFEFCFSNRDNMELPDIAFHFTGAIVAMRVRNLFISFEDRDNMFCLAVLPSINGLSVFGNIAQVDFQVEYDLQEMKVSFLPTDCAKV